VSLNTIDIEASPQRVWDVLADPENYPRWVVGARDLRDADPAFPAVGTRFHHKVGFGPVTVKDHTEVLDAYPPYRLELRAKARPLGTATVILLLQPWDGGTRVTMIEDAGDALTRFVFNPLTHLLVRGRNVWALERLKALAEHGPQAAREVEAEQKNQHAMI
jgi:uncharacterized protein YndB with AHSA1/START domain